MEFTLSTATRRRVSTCAASIVWTTTLASVLAILVAHAVAVLRYGELYRWRYGEVLKHFGLEIWHTNWVGLQFPVDWITAQDISIVFALFGAVLALIIFVLIETVLRILSGLAL